ncbi:short tail fiber protein [Ralstonia phage phiAp1]|uniref:Putative short tail fiber n=1 Tax=Ralstonia phage phiAp1 TaxID=2783867 RepID=A0A1L7DS85_9CAUD|nr:short tail fiber protein [Ralstonia phage phiAp1]APU03184.1 putative short tail fiber [Ralstonia phage phiAp1]
MEVPSTLTSRDEQVLRLQDAVAKLPQVECRVRNYFAPGVYCREMTIPAGVVAVGARHKTEHLSILVQGHVHITTDDGTVEVHAPATFLSKAGAKRACFAVTEAIITTIHPTDETDLDKLCELLTDTTSDRLIGGSNNVQLQLSGRAEEGS